MGTSSITSKNEIIRLLRMAKHENTPMFLRVGLQEYPVFFAKISEDLLIVDCKGKISKEINFANFFFDFGKDFYFSQFKILDHTDLKELVIAFPEVLHFRSKRKYKRMPTNGSVFCTFNIITIVSEEKHVETDKIPHFLRNLYYELKKDVPDLKRVFNEALEEIKKISNKSFVKFYKENEVKDEIDMILAGYNCSLYISDARDMKSYINNYKSQQIMSYSRFFKTVLDSKKMSEDNVKAKILQLMAEDKKVGRLSYIYVPLFVFGEVVGYLYSSYDYSTGKLYNERDIVYIKAIADVISEALNKNRLFKIETEQKFTVPVENISCGGMMIKVTDPYLLKFLLPQTKLSLAFKLNEEVINCIGSVTRIEDAAGTCKIGIKFMELDFKSEKFIESYISFASISDIIIQ